MKNEAKPTYKAEIQRQSNLVAPDEPSLLRRSLSGAACLTFELSGLQGLSLLIFGYLSHLLSPDDFGLASIAFVATQTLRSTVQDRIPEAAAIRPEASEEIRRPLFGSLLLLVAC